MKKGLIKFTAVLLSAIMLSGCDSGSVSSDINSTTSSGDVTTTSSGESTPTDSSDDSEELTEEQIYNNMIERSLINYGNNERLAKFFHKLENGEETTIAFLGGSITEGLTAGPEKCWAKLTYDYLCEKYPDTKINYVNAGMSGTPSILGNARLERDILSHNPDLLFVEFAVNDGTDAFYKDSYEAIVRRTLMQENNPAVVLYFTVLKSGYSAESYYMSAIGEHYDLPMISLNSALAPEFKSGRMTWEKYSDDESHPNIWGHEMTRDLIVNMFNKELEKIETEGADSGYTIPENTLNSDRFMGVQLYDRDHPLENVEFISAGGFTTDIATHQHFPAGWSYKGTPSECAPMEFKFTGDTLFLLYECANSRVYGSVKITIDGKEIGSYATSANDGWNNPVAKFITTVEEGTHTVQVVPEFENDGRCYVEIIGFGIG